MSLRISSALGLIGLLAACGGESPPPPGATVDCAIGAGAAFSPVCTLEKLAGTPQFIVHHPDGGFRRLIFDPETGAIGTADGANAVIKGASGAGTFSFAVGEDRYSIPNDLLLPPAP